MQWDLDQELAEKTAAAVTNCSPLNNLPSRVGGDIQSINQGQDTGSGTPPTQPNPLTPSLPDPPASGAPPEALADIQDFFQYYGIGTINYLLRHYSVAQLERAIADFERVFDYGYRIRNNGAFFRSLL